MFKTNKFRIALLVVACLIFFGFFSLYLSKGFMRSGKNSAYKISNTGVVGIIDGNLTVSQTFAATKDFNGVSVLVGTYAQKQFGEIRAVITNVETGEVVMDKNFNTIHMYDNEYYYFADEKIIGVDEPTEFEITFSQKWQVYGPGVTYWCSEEDEYSKGELTMNGETKSGDLVFGLVTDYKEYFQWGMFLKRLELMLLVFIFVVLNLITDLKLLYEFIFKWRWVIALALFVFLVANKFNYSSLSQYDNYIQPGQGSEYVEPVFGSSRAIRSDEWLVSVPRMMSASYGNFDGYNFVSRATKTEQMVASGFKRSYSALAEPSNWGYYLFGVDYGMAFAWNYGMILSFMFGLELCLMLTRNKKTLSVFGGSIIAFSSFRMWWGITNWALSASAVVVLFNYMIKADKKRKQLLYGIGTALFGASYICALYPAWQVPVAYVLLALLVWIIYKEWPTIKAFKAVNWVIIAFCVLFMISVVVVYFLDYSAYMVAITNTVYPGARVTYGGMSIQKLLGYYATALAPYIEYGNPSEMGCFFGAFPFGVIIFFYSMIKNKGKNVLNWCILVPFLLLGFYCTVGLPPIICKLTLLTYGTAARVVDILGFVCVLMMIVGISELEGERLKLYVSIPIALVSAGVPLWYDITTIDSGKRSILIAALAIIYCVAIVAILSGVKELLSKRTMIAVATFVTIDGLSVNPIVYGTEAITSKPASKEIQEIVSEDEDGKWIGVGSVVLGNYLIALGAPTYNSTNCIPNMELWEKMDPDGDDEYVYNRYAHIVINMTNEESSLELTQDDAFVWNLSYDDLMNKLDVDYIASAMELKNIHLLSLYNNGGIYIYKVLR